MATEKDLRNKIVEAASSYVGVNEGEKKHHEIIDIFNKVKPDGWAMIYSAAWCAAFASAMAIKAFGTSKAAEYLPLSANCAKMITKAQKLGIWVEDDAFTPQPGDFILYDWDDSGKGDNKGTPDHVGIVTKVTTKQFKVIEGNYSDMVKERTIAKNGRYIRGFVTPKYDAMAKAKETTSKKKTYTYTVKKGDTLSQIAKHYGVTVAAIAKENKISNVNLIFRGQILKITK